MDNQVTSFMFYMWNEWSKEECEKAFAEKATCGWTHLWNKWVSACNNNPSRWGAVEEFYAELSDTNRDILVSYILTVYKGRARL